MRRKIPPEAFDFYFSLGPDRSYSSVAAKYGVSKKAVTNLAVRESWQSRLLELETRARQKCDDKTVETLASVRDRHLRAIRIIQGKALSALKSMPIQSAMDAIRALGLSIKEERVILGEPSERTAVSIESAIKREYERWMVAETSTRNENSGHELEISDGS